MLLGTFELFLVLLCFAGICQQLPQAVCLLQRQMTLPFEELCWELAPEERGQGVHLVHTFNGWRVK